MKLFLTLSAVFVVTILAVSFAFAEVPQMITYQGYLTMQNGNPVQDDSLDLTFTIYNASVGGANLWSSGVQRVDLTGGSFTYLLGSLALFPTDLFSADTLRWLGIRVDTDPELTPRTRLASVPYAFHSLRSDTADFAISAGIGWIDAGTVVRLEDTTDMVGIGTTNPEQKLHVAGIVRCRVGNPDPYYSDFGSLYNYNESFHIRVRGGDPSETTIFGFGLTDTWLSSYGTSKALIIKGITGNIGVGTTEPDEKLTVAGNVHITGDLTVDGSSTVAPILDGGYEDVVAECGTRRVTFNVTFTAPPSVVVGYKGDEGCDEHGNWFVFDVTPDGFTLRNGRPNQAGGRSAYWIAVGPGL